MSLFETAIATQAYRSQNEDRAVVFHAEDRTVIVVADGVGGSGAGSVAAETVLSEVKTACPRVTSAQEWRDVLTQVDARIGEGESTAVVVDLRPDGIIGASIGDSAAWIIDGDQCLDLTSRQTRKPLLGSGIAQPIEFESPPLQGILLVATDGFANYVKRERLFPLVAQGDYWTLAQHCLRLVQLPSGEWWADTTIVTCRVKPRVRTRRRYTL